MLHILSSQDHISNKEKIDIEEVQYDLGQILSYHWSDIEYCTLPKKLSKKQRKSLRILQSYQEDNILPSHLHITKNYLSALQDATRYYQLETPHKKAHYVNFREINTGINKKFSGILTCNMCLYNVNGITAHMENGTTAELMSGKKQDRGYISNFTLQDQATFYEIESLYRQSSFINEFTQAKDGLLKKVQVQLPLVEYYLYGIEKFEEGLLSHETLLELFEKIDQRAERFFQLFKKRIKGNVELEFTSPLLELKAYLIEKIRINQKPQIKDAVDILSQYPLWNHILGQGTNPESILSLSKQYGESVCEIQNSFDNAGDASLILKNPKESKIFYKSKKIADWLCKEKDVPLRVIGMYIQEQI